MPRWRECRLYRVIMQRTLTPSRLSLAALRSLQRIRLGISVSYVIQRVHDSPVEIMGPAAEAAAWNGHHSESAPATRRRSFGPVSTIMQNLYAKMARAPPPPQGASGGLRVWLQRRAGDPLVPFRQSCRISMPRWRERRRRRRVIVQRTLTPSRLPSAALRSLERIRLGISVSYVIQRVHE